MTVLLACGACVDATVDLNLTEFSDASESSPTDLAVIPTDLGVGASDIGVIRGPHEDALIRGPHEDALIRGPHEDALITPDPDLGFPPGDTGSSVDAGLPVPDGGMLCSSDFDCRGLNETCQVGVCDMNTGLCFRADAPDGTLCNDGIACTFVDACRAGACTSTPNPPSNDSCALPARVFIGPGRTQRVIDGSTWCSADDARGSCGGTGAGDSIFQFELNDRQRLRLTVENPRPSENFDPVLYVRESCLTSGSETACNDDGPGLGRIPRIEEFFESGTHFVFIDGANASTRGQYRLIVDIDPHDGCLAPVQINLPVVNDSVIFNESTRRASNRFTAQCGTLDARSHDQAYQLTLTQNTRVRVEARGANMYDPLLHIHRAPCVERSLQRDFCDDNSGADRTALIETTLTAGTWIIVVDSAVSFRGGEYTLEVTHLPL